MTSQNKKVKPALVGLQPKNVSGLFLQLCSLQKLNGFQIKG